MTQVVDTFNVLTKEKVRGGVASAVSGCVANLMNVAMILFGMNPLISTTLSLQIFGNMLTYFLDIMMAKKKFHGKTVPYTDHVYRFSWFVKSFMGPPFHKFIVACIIEGVFVYAALMRAREFCEKRKIRFKLRDAGLAAIIGAVSFVFVMNFLRFNWVLEEEESLVLNIVIIAWMAIMVFMILLVPLRQHDESEGLRSLA